MVKDDESLPEGFENRYGDLFTNDPGLRRIVGYGCVGPHCRIGARTLGLCAHTMTVLMFLGYYLNGGEYKSKYRPEHYIDVRQNKSLNNSLRRPVESQMPDQSGHNAKRKHTKSRRSKKGKKGKVVSDSNNEDNLSEADQSQNDQNDQNNHAQGNESDRNQPQSNHDCTNENSKDKQPSQSSGKRKREKSRRSKKAKKRKDHARAKKERRGANA